VAEWLDNVGVMVLVVGGWLAGCIGFVVVMVVGDGGYSDLVEVVEG
jgi:hypothetical protein